MVMKILIYIQLIGSAGSSVVCVIRYMEPKYWHVRMPTIKVTTLKLALQQLYPRFIVRHQAIVDLKELSEAPSTIYDEKGYQLKQTVKQIRDFFEFEERNSLQWIQRAGNLADSLTKHNPVINRFVSRALKEGQ